MAVVVLSSYPGGPDGAVARLERADLWGPFRATAKRFWAASLVLVALSALFVVLNTRPNVFGLLAVPCGGLAFLRVAVPFIEATHDIATRYYIDAGWIASYHGYRINSVQLSQVTSVKVPIPGHVGFRQGRRAGVFVPEAILLLEPVRTTVSRAVREGAPLRPLTMSSAAERIFPFPSEPHLPVLLGQASEMGRPPLRPWRDVSSRRRAERQL
jgi:hypothetical protein